MSWSFATEPEFQRELDWVEQFVTEHIEPLDEVIGHAFDMADPVRQRLIPPLQQQVRDRGLWACHLGPQLGGAGFGQVKLALLNEILGRTHGGPIVFGCQAPDSGNAEILARYGSPELRRRYLEPLLAQDVVSAFSMTEQAGGSDPTQFTTRAQLDGDEWVINGEKWFTSHARFAAFLIVLAMTDPDVEEHGRMSMFVVPADAAASRSSATSGLYGGDRGTATHAFVRFTDVRCTCRPTTCSVERGDGFAVAQTRLGGGRIHHAMRTVGLVKQALAMMCERALSRTTKGSLLGASSSCRR